MANKELVDCFHHRADHEDNLHNTRMGIFLAFNSFMAVAVGFSKDKIIMLLFSVLALLIDFFWLKSANQAADYIRTLRKKGGSRPDQALWEAIVGPKRKSINSMSITINTRIPMVLFLAWIVLTIYCILKLIDFPFWDSIKITNL